MEYDVIIVGAGSMGAAAGYYLSKEGKKVLLIDAYNPPHTFGSHHGDTRLIRHAYGEGESYVPLALAAQKLWLSLEKEAGEEIFLNTGVLSIGDEESDFIKTVIKSAQNYKLPVEVLSATEIQKRYKGLNMPNDFIGCLETSSGILFCQKAIQAYLKLSLENGATLLTNSKVTAIETIGDRVQVVTNGKTYTANSLVVSAGGFSRSLLELLDLDLLIQPHRALFAWFDVKDDDYKASEFPGFSVELPEGIYYGFPNVNGEGLKVGRHEGTPINEGEYIPFGKQEGDGDEIQKFVKTYFKNAGELKYGKNCQYTMTPDEDFIIDTHPNASNIIIATGFSGHGFKFSSVVGKIISDLAIKGKTEHDISKFTIERFF